jgi:cytochrome c biogenesis protein CcmG/thiol:disulfide interchange protein DsbE
MSKKTTYKILIIAIVALVGLYFYNKYNVAPSIQVDKLEILNEDSTKFDIHSLKGKKVIISFYASWCPNCIEELKVLNTIKNEKLSDIEILAITDESMDKLISFKNKKQYPFTFLKLNASFPEIGIASIPTTYLLNTKGEIVYNKVGYIEWDDESNLNHLKSLME